MNFLIIGDIHLYLNKRLRLFEPVNTQLSIDSLYNAASLEYIKSCYELYKHLELTVIFLGDIFDTPYLKLEEIEDFILLLQYISTKHKVKVIVGNHDSSSRKPQNKLKYSPIQYFPIHSNIQIITDTHIEVLNNDLTLFFLSYAERIELYDKLINCDCTTNKLCIFTHNNFYLTETYNETHMFPINIVQNIFKNKHVTFVNGHIHTYHHENEMIHKNLNYYQTGSVNPTSFKFDPIASGILLLNSGNLHNPSVCFNNKLTWMSIDNHDYIDKFERILIEGTKIGITVFLRYPSFLEKKIRPLIEKYTIIKAIQIL